LNILAEEDNMRKTLGILIVGPLLLLLSGTAPAGGDDDARAIVAKSIKATGGAAKMAKFKATTFKVKGTYYGMGDGLPFTGNYAVQWPMQLKMEIEGIFTIVVNGDKGWMKSGGVTNDMSKEELALQKHNQRAGWIATLLPLEDKAFDLTALGEVKVDKLTALGVKVTRKDYPEVKLYFDKATHLLIKAEFRSKSPEENYKDATLETYYSNFKEIDGVKVPTTVITKRDGKLYVESEVAEMKAAGKLDASMFDRP
jgi:zinc protease